MTGTYRLGVIGDPVAHSLSPELHQPALDALGIPATYERWHTTLAELPERLRGCRSADVLGANVTVPHKVAVIEHLDTLSPLARRAGAVNTVVNRAGSLFGENTDIAGFIAAVRRSSRAPMLKRAVVLGAGGAARAVVLGLEVIGVNEIVVSNRSLTRGQELAEDLMPAPVVPISLNDRGLVESMASADILVNATSIGWKSNEAPIDLSLLAELPRDALVVDLTYRETDLLLSAKALGRETVDGMPMLVHQGAAAFALFTGQEPPLDLMFAAVEKSRQ